MQVLVIIPARGGSKGIVKKNIALLGGRPLITYVLETALSLTKITKIVVTTDCEEIKNAVVNYDIDIVHRPENLATDSASSVDVALDLLSLHQYSDYTHFLYIEPTSPFLTRETISKCLVLLRDHEHVMTYQKVDGIYGIISDKKFLPFIKGEARRRQDRALKFREVSALYGLNIAAFFKLRSLSNDHAVPIILDAYEAWDINTQIDLEIAELILQKRQNNND